MKYRRKVTVYLVVICFCILLNIFLFADIPALTAKMAFRRAERPVLLGPAKILDTLELEQLVYDRVTIGKSDHGYSIYAWNEGKDRDSGHFSYYPKTGNLTLILSGFSDLLPYVDGWQYPIFAFTERSDAVTATLTLELSLDDDIQRYQLEAEEQYDCLFLFCLNGDVMSKEAYHAFYAGSCIRIQVSIYDIAGNVLATDTKEYN